MNRKLAFVLTVLSLTSVAALPAFAGDTPNLPTGAAKPEAFSSYRSDKGPKPAMLGAVKSVTIGDYLAADSSAALGMARIQADTKAQASLGAIPKTRSALKQNASTILSGFAKAAPKAK